ncbi:MAG: metal-dependent phosphohydrolase [Treponema sp.]|jgi:hypothetical protein|nr:metal-dependent phosphohydrolase [Treponema sp.]
MPENEDITLLSKVLTLPEGKGVNRAYIEIITDQEIPVLCINRGAKKRRLMPFKVLYDNHVTFWKQPGDWEYYLTSDGIDIIRQKSETKTGIWEVERLKFNKKSKLNAKSNNNEDHDEPEKDAGYGSEYNKFADMTTEEKVEFLDNNQQRLADIIVAKTKDINLVTEVLVETTKDAALINHTALEEAMRLGDDEAKKLTQDVVDSTHELVKTSTYLISEDVFNNDLMNTLVEKSNGTIVQHMTRVYLNGIAFLTYYNKLVSTSSAIQKLRINFGSRYRDFYHSLLPHFSANFITLERVFLGGMRAVPPEILSKWAVGFLIHDIGKASAVEYHEGEAAYDRNIVIEHVKLGYKSIMTKTNYPMEASLITGYHHEYYGAQDGYGYFRAYLQQHRKTNPLAKQDYCISFEIGPVRDYQVLAYFPAKVLEIIDVYDSVTDPHRVYRRAMNQSEALAMMHEQFIVKHRKIDPILFDIFAEYINEKTSKNK